VNKSNVSRRLSFPDQSKPKEELLEISEHLQALELELLSNMTRKNAARLSSLLADSFKEFGSSGRVYSKEDVIVALQEEPASLSLTNFEMRLLAEGVALVTYQSRNEGDEASPTVALRSSIWIQEGEDWRMIFHQGTRLSHAAETQR
jgi:hypothetical protein